MPLGRLGMGSRSNLRPRPFWGNAGSKDRGCVRFGLMASRTNPTPSQRRRSGNATSRMQNQPRAGAWMIRGQESYCLSDGAQILRGGLAGPSISNKIERDLLSLVEATHPSAFDCADMHEHILATVIWLDESKAFLPIEPLHGSLCHIALLRCTCALRPRLKGKPVHSRFGGKSSVRRVMRGAAKSFGPSSIAAI